MENAKKLVSLCTQKQITISSCESLTAGLFTSTIASIPGASAILKGGIVTYFTEMKKVLVHVDEEIIEKFGVVSEPCAIAMAKNTRELMEVDYCVSFTGNAGPSQMEEKPAGRVYCAIASKDEVIPFMFQCNDMERNEVRQCVVDLMIDELLEIVDKR